MITNILQANYKLNFTNNMYQILFKMTDLSVLLTNNLETFLETQCRPEYCPVVYDCGIVMCW